MRNSTVELGGLTCHVVDNLPTGQAPKLIVITCHGFGAPGTDLVSLGPELLRMNPQLQAGVQFVFPEAPLSLTQLGMPGGRAWWLLDIAKMTAAIEQGEFRDLRNDHPDGLDEARAMLLKAIDELKAESGLPTSQFVLSGFSQGSMLATDVMLHLPESPAALAIFSGTLLCEDQWKKLAAEKQSIPVLQSHGQQDPILPFQAAVWLKDMLEEAKFPVNFIPFEGYHTIPLPALEQFGDLLGELVG